MTQAAVEESKNEKQELIQDFEEKLNIPSKNGQELNRKASPNRVGGKKLVDKKPSSKASKGDPTGAKTFYKNKKTTK